MSDALNCKGYGARAACDAEDRPLFGRIAGIEDGVGFHADPFDGLEAALPESDGVNGV